MDTNKDLEVENFQEDDTKVEEREDVELVDRNETEVIENEGVNNKAMET